MSPMGAGLWRLKPTSGMAEDYGKPTRVGIVLRRRSSRDGSSCRDVFARRSRFRPVFSVTSGTEVMAAGPERIGTAIECRNPARPPPSLRKIFQVQRKSGRFSQILVLVDRMSVDSLRLHWTPRRHRREKSAVALAIRCAYVLHRDDKKRVPRLPADTPLRSVVRRRFSRSASRQGRTRFHFGDRGAAGWNRPDAEPALPIAPIESSMGKEDT